VRIAGGEEQPARTISGGEFGGAAALAAGQHYLIALKKDGTVWGWGDNGAGQLGNGTMGVPEGTPCPGNESYDSASSEIYPVRATGLTQVTAISTHSAANTNHAMALKSDGSVWAWGANGGGLLGWGLEASDPVLAPVQVAGL